MGKNVIVACDFNSEEELVNFLDKMEGADPNFYCKVGMELFDAGALQGFNPVEIIKERGHKVFLDLKLKDIPNTVAKTAKVLVKAGADMINVHADGGYKMMKGVADAINDEYEKLKERYNYLLEVIDEVNAEQNDIQDDDINNTIDSYDKILDYQCEMEEINELLDNKPILLGVTVLTSMSEDELKNEIGVNKTPREQVISLAKLCKEAGFDGVVCSPQEILDVKEACGEDFITVTPGIRFADSKKDDQTRVATPACANIMGSDYIVVGRPITKAEDNIKAYERCKKDFTQPVVELEELDNAYEYIKNLKEKNIKENASDVVARKLIDASAFKVNTEDPYLLKSGIGSPLYCNCRDLYKNPAEQKVIMDYLAELIREYYPKCQAIFGTPMSAISFGALVAERLGLPFGFVREEQKDHGLNTKIEGLYKDINVVQVEDLITSGTSSLKPVMALKEAGANVLGVAGIVDNNFIPSSKLIENGIEYHTITTMSNVAHYAGEAGIITPDAFDKVKAYENNPKDESWMSEEAAEKIMKKRLAMK